MTRHPLYSSEKQDLKDDKRSTSWSSIWRALTCKDTIQPIENPPSFQSPSPFVNVIIIFLHYMHSGTILPLDYCTFNG